MKLDLDFLRKILLKIDSWESFKPMKNEDLIDSDISIDKINAYLDLLHEEELIDIQVKAWIDGSKTYEIKYLTFKGERFVNSIKNPNLWEKQKDSVVKKGISFLSDIVSKIILGLV